MDTLYKTSSEAPKYKRWQIERLAGISQVKIVLIIIFLLSVLGGQRIFAQGVGISEVSITPDASSILELRSTQRGFLIPRMTQAQRNLIAGGSPSTGLIVYNTSTNKLNIYDGTVWRVLFSGDFGVNSITGTLNRISIAGTSADPIIDIDANYIGQNTITTLGTITTGTWNADVVNVQYGGTGLSSITANNLLYGNGTGAISLLAPSATTGTILMNTAAGAPSWTLLSGLPSNAGILPIANGGTNSGVALAGSSIMISDGTAIVQGQAGTNSTVLHGNATGVPTYGQVVTNDIADNAVTSAKILDDEIVDADVNSTAAIAGTKINPDFGAQNIITTGTLAAGATTVTGNITVTGTVDTRDVNLDGTNQDAIQTLTGVAAPNTDLGVFTGITITDNAATIKSALQELETSLETQTDNQTAVEVTSTATGNIVATNVDAAIAELEAEKLALAGGTMTGAINMGTNNISNAGTITATGFSGPLTGNVTGNVSGTAANVTGTVAIANGGTGQTTQQAALDALAGAVTSGQFLRGDGTNVAMSAIQVADVPTLNQNTTGTAATLTTARAINGVNFDGSADITVTAAAGTLTGNTLNATVVSSSLTSVGTLTDLTVTNTITGSVTGNAATATTATNIAGGATGSIPYQSGANTTLMLPTGTAGYILAMNPGATAPQWQAAGAGNMILATPQSVTGLKTFDDSKIAVKGSSTGVTYLSSANAIATNYTVTLPSADATLAIIEGDLSQFAATTSAQLAGVLSDKTGSGGATVFANNPALTGFTSTGADVNINVNSNFNTNINTGTSTGAVAIGSTSGGSSLTQRVGIGNFSLDGVGASTYTIAPSTTTGTIAIGGTSQTGAITVGSSDAAQTLNLGTGTAAATVNIATGNVTGNVNIGDNTGPTSSSVLIGGSTTVNGAFNYGVDAAGGGNAYVITLSPAPTAYVAGMMVIFKAGNSNTGSCTMNVNGLGAKNIQVNQDGGGLQNAVSDDIGTDGVYILVYDGTQFVLIIRYF